MNGIWSGIRKWAIPAAISGGLLWAILNQISGAAVSTALARVDLRAVAISISILAISYAIRSWRWTIPLRSAVVVTMAIGAVGLAANHFLPARGGELLRSWLLRRSAGVAMTESLAVVFGERLTDAIVLAGLGGLATLTMTNLPDWFQRAGWIGAAAALSAAAGFALAPMIHSAMRTRFAGLAVQLEPAIAGIRSVRNPVRLVPFVLATVAIWLLDAWAGHWIASGMGIPVPYGAQLVLLTGLAFSGAVPAIPGNVGVYQFVAIQILGPIGVDASQAVVFLLLFQAIDYTVATAAGLAGYLVLPSELRDISQWRKARSERS